MSDKRTISDKLAVGIGQAEDVLPYQAGQNCWQVATANRVAVIIDAADYFLHLRAAMLSARERILMIGWDFDTRILLTRSPVNPMEPPSDLGGFILWIAQNRPTVGINILKWNFGSLKMLGRGSTLFTAARWALHPRIKFKLDSAHPLGCSHHQKIVVIDDALAFCGGIDATGDRWDTRDHRGHDARRRRPSGRYYGPWHDLSMAVDGPAASALGKLGRDRWQRARGGTLAPCRERKPLWPDKLKAQFHQVDLAISRTRSDYQGNGDVREIETMVLDQIAAARHFIYAENQYFTSRRIAEAMAKRLSEADPPEIFLVQPETADGWLERQAMDGARRRLVRALRQQDSRKRFHIMVPHSDDGTPIYVHAKLMIVDDLVLRVGSSNMNNRSLGLDSECDLTLKAHGQGDAVAQTIRRLRASLLAEHCGLNPMLVEARLASGHQMAQIAGTAGQSQRRLERLAIDASGEIEALVADHELLDPEDTSQMFEPFSHSGLFRRRTVLSKPQD